MAHISDISIYCGFCFHSAGFALDLISMQEQRALIFSKVLSGPE